MTSAPFISVLIPVFNSGNTLRAAVWSVLNQSFEDFECLIYLDGCTDVSAEIAAAISDSRIRLIVSNENKGIVHARNSLVKEARGNYLAWLDADDIMLPDRLFLQKTWLDTHPEIAVLGSWVEVRSDKKVSKVKWPASAELVKSWLFFRNPLVQSSLMLRREIPGLSFDPAFEYLEDYAFYSGIYLKQKIAIYPAFLTSYLQDHEASLIRKYRTYDFVGKLEKIMLQNFSILEISPGANLLSLMRDFLRSRHKLKPEDARQVLSFLLLCDKQNKRLKPFDPAAFSQVISFLLLKLMRQGTGVRFAIGWWFATHPFKIAGALKAKPVYQ